MIKHACRYSIIRFTPFPETEEFANVGIVLACPEAGFFDFKLQKRRYKRVTDFFNDVDSLAYRESISRLEQELLRIKDFASGAEPDELRTYFKSLIHPREAILRFSDSRSRLAENPAEIIEQLFRYYVEREFVNQEYKEKFLERHIRTLVHGLNLVRPFKAMSIGDEYASAPFPLVQTFQNIPTKVIKPFYLDQSEPGKIISHGGPWVDRMKRLRKRNLLPNDVLFAVEGPSPESEKRYLAFKEICEDLKEYEIKIVNTSQEQKIIDFARSESLV